MSSIGFGLLKSIIDDQVTLSEAKTHGVKDDKFEGKEQEAFLFIKSHFTAHGRYPELSTVELEIDSSVFDSLPSEPIGYWAEQVNARWQHNKLIQLRDSISDRLANENGVQPAIDFVNEIQQELAQDLSYSHVREMHAVQTEVLEHHNVVQQMSVIPGIPFGLPFIDDISGGAQSGDIIVLVGESGVGKTFLSLALARAARYAEYNVIMVCTEMPELQIARRDLAMKGGINANEIKMGHLSEYSTNRLTGIIELSSNREGHADNFYKILPGGIYSTYEHIHTIVKETKPHLLVIDGAALIRSEKFRGSRWERIIEIIEQFKELALKEDQLRVILTFHYGKSGPGKYENIYGGMAISQFASIILSFEYERAEDINNPSPVQYRNLKILKGRDGETGTLRLLYDMRKSSITQDKIVEGGPYQLQEGEEPHETHYDPDRYENDQEPSNSIENI